MYLYKITTQYIIHEIHTVPVKMIITWMNQLHM